MSSPRSRNLLVDSKHVQGSQMEVIQSALGLPQEYARKVLRYSQRSVEETKAVSHAFADLALFLWSPYANIQREIHATNSIVSHKAHQNPFVVSYELQPGKHLLVTPLSLPLQRPNSNQKETLEPNSLLFLRGYPSAQWLNELGARYDINPRFYLHHLQFLSSARESGQRTSFINPSTQQTVFRLSFMTIGEASTGVTIRDQRDKAGKKMNAYLHKLRMGTGWKPGDSIVRTYDALTERIFSIEQSATVYLARSQKHEHWTVIVWLDSGEDLCDSPIGPWLKSAEAKFHTYFRHIYQHEENIATLAAPDAMGSASGLRDTQDHSGPFQSIRLLPLSYGNSLDPSIACVDPFYALSEVFSFAAASHIEFLNTIASILDSSITELPDPEADTTTSFQETLVHCQRILEWHVHKVSDIADMIKNRELLGWPTSRHETAVKSALFLERDFDYVLQHSRALWEKCQRELTAITNHANFTEARRGIEQGKRVFRITLLATIYVPLSFSCAMFGMNFVQFDRYWHGYVVWALSTCPVFLFTVLIMDLDKGKARRQLKRVFKAAVGWYRDIRD